ncbi:six-bladed beta-propeller, TolB-like protein [Tanacetum coccineum]
MTPLRPVVNKCIKTLLNLKLIKEVRHVPYSNAKYYIGAEFTPTDDFTGRSWYVDGKLDKAFTDQIKEVCYKILTTKLSVTTSAGLYEYLRNRSVLSSEYNTFNQLSLPSSVNGLESAAFDRGGDGSYVIVADGRILKWKGPSIGFVDFATKNLCDGTNDLNLGPICGRPLALSFNYKTSDLYITDAFFGLLVVGFNGGLATQLPVVTMNHSGIDKHRHNQGIKLDSTGRLLKYDPRTQRVTTLLSGLSRVGGPAVSSDRKAANDGEFWVAAENPAQGLRVNGSATVLQTVPLTQYSGMAVFEWFRRLTVRYTFKYAPKAKDSLLRTSNDNKLALYGLYKQATVGPVNTDRPGMFSMAERAKWDAWKAVEGKSKEEAMSDYITKVKQ